MNADVLWNIDECAPYFDRMKIRGWCAAPKGRIVKVTMEFCVTGTRIVLASYGLDSADVAANLKTEAFNARFDEWVLLKECDRGNDFHLICCLENGEEYVTGSAHSKCREGDPGHRCWYRYLNMLGHYSPGAVIEIGSRARSGVTRGNLLPKQHRYVGFDINAGPNVDVVGDAHELSRHVGSEKFVGVMAHAVFEHLAMPWKVVLEINKILVPGGLVFVSCPQAWPVHEDPCDYWRFSRYSWQWLFNRFTGFEIIETAHGEPARMHPLWDSAVVRDMHLSTAYLISAVIARKVGETTLEWNVPCDQVSDAKYSADITCVQGLVNSG